MTGTTGRGRRLLAAAAALLAAIPITLVATANASIPTTPPGWTLAWGDDFNGTNGSLPSSANWIVDLGHAYPGGPGNWGTGEIQNYTNSPDNLKLDDSGNLRITALRDGAGNWTSGQDVGQIANGGSLHFSGVRFGGTTATRFTARVASGAGGGLVEARIDSPTGAVVGSFAVGNTGGRQSWRTVPANMSGVTGTHDVHITSTSGQPSPCVSVNWVRFGT